MKKLHRILLEGNPLRSIRRSLIVGETSELKKYLTTRGPNPIAEGSSSARTGDDGGLSSSSGHNIVSLILRNSAASGILQISDYDVTSLPTVTPLFHISLATTLHTLDLSNSALSEVSEEIRVLQSVKVIKLDRNNLDRLPNAIGQLPELEELYVSRNKLVSENLESLNFIAGGSAPLKTISFSSNQLTYGTSV